MKKATIFLFFCFALHQNIFAQTPQIKWWFDVLDSSFGQSAAGDIDKDGTMEIVFGCYRNDSCIYALNAENGTLQWKYNAKSSAAEGCNDVAMLIYDVDNDDTMDVVVPSSCNPKTFCFRGKNGDVKWQTPTGGSDSPPSIADIDNDGKPEILHGGFDGKVMCFNAEDGSVAWTKTVFSNSWVQTAPTIVDLDGNGQLDFVVATWAYSPDTSRIYAYRGNDQTLLWSVPVSDYTYHGTAISDFDNDGKPELVIGDYNGKIYALNGENGSILWTYQASVYVGAPVTLADVNQDGSCDVIFCDGYGVGVLSNTGSLMWYYSIPGVGQTFRGVAVSDINGDQMLDIVFGTNKGKVYVLNGASGTLIWDLDLEAHIGKAFDINHAPLISDFDHDGMIDIFLVGGDTEYPNFQNNYGRAYMISAGAGHGPDWLMFQHDVRRKSSMCDAPLSIPEPDSKVFLNIFPNPSSGMVEIRSTQNGQLEIFNTLGKTLRISTKTHFAESLDLSKWPSGIYFVTLKTEKGSVTQKIMLGL
ncbi:MAG: VCBS repeat-containing protein [Chitinophagaceae bacterium]|nr:VCBS repeat-containing protein [Chitinophagaceae bacterium]